MAEELDQLAPEPLAELPPGDEARGGPDGRSPTWTCPRSVPWRFCGKIWKIGKPYELGEDWWPSGSGRFGRGSGINPKKKRMFSRPKGTCSGASQRLSTVMLPRDTTITWANVTISPTESYGVSAQGSGVRTNDSGVLWSGCRAFRRAVEGLEQRVPKGAVAGKASASQRNQRNTKIGESLFSDSCLTNLALIWCGRICAL